MLRGNAPGGHGVAALCLRWNRRPPVLASPRVWLNCVLRQRSSPLVVAVLNVLPVTLLIAALTLLLSVVLRSRNTAGGVVAALVAASYFMTTLGDMVDGPLGNIKYLSFFQYYDGTNVLTTGVNWAGFAGLLVMTGVLLALSVVFFQRRDLLGG